jgi:hypothetical protein
MASSPRVQRQCACGAPSAGGGSCAACEEKASLKGLQRKALAIGAADDPLEREADQVAERVMRMEVQAETPVETSRLSKSVVSRSTDGAAVAGEAPASVHATVASPGQPLGLSVRTFFEPRFGADFSQVRVHTGELAQQSARDVHALAYTVGSHVVFGAGLYAPDTASGKHLLAHELTHVQQQGVQAHTAPFKIQRQLISATRRSISLYEIGESLDAPRQTLTSSTSSGGASLQLSYDPGTSFFEVTFPLIWIFPHAWNDSQRTTYVDDFKHVVEAVWNNRFLLREATPSRRTAHVRMLFSNVITMQGASQAEENAQLLGATSGRWLMDVRHPAVREEVHRQTGVVELGATSNSRITQSSADLRRGRSFAISGTGGNRSFTQSASAHEFGHMIGLGDEYLEDAGTPIPSALRGQISDRIMNVGENVTADAYAPFADWLSRLTATRWIVGPRIR